MLRRRPKSDRLLAETIARLKESGRVLIKQREEWKARATESEQQARLAMASAAKLEEEVIRLQASGKMSHGDEEGRYRKLKRMIALELHPDHQASAIEKMVKAEIFKVIWAKIEEIDKAG